MCLSFPPCHPQLCPAVRGLLESLDAEYVKNRIGKSQPGEVAKGLLQPHSGEQATLCLRNSRSGEGVLEAEDPLS